MQKTPKSLHNCTTFTKLFNWGTANKTVNVSLQTGQQKESPPINREAQSFVRCSADGGANACA